MKNFVLLPGKIKPTALAAAQAEYTQRLKRFGFEVLEYKDEKVSSRNPDQTRKTEADRIVHLLKEDDYVVACDERGHAIQTMALADLLRASRQGAGVFSGKRRMVIVIGGALGLAESVRQRADAIWALSSLVMAGGVARVVLLEGLYRAVTVVENHPYHNT